MAEKGEWGRAYEKTDRLAGAAETSSYVAKGAVKEYYPTERKHVLPNSEPESVAAAQARLAALPDGAEASYQDELNDTGLKRYASKVDKQKKTEGRLKKFRNAAMLVGASAAAFLGIKGVMTEKPDLAKVGSDLADLPGRVIGNVEITQEQKVDAMISESDIVTIKTGADETGFYQFVDDTKWADKYDSGTVVEAITKLNPGLDPGRMGENVEVKVPVMRPE